MQFRSHPLLLVAATAIALLVTPPGPAPEVDAASRSSCKRRGCQWSARLWRCVCPSRRGRGGAMARISAGCYMRGKALGRRDETPLHKVCLRTFHIDRHEVTIGDYKRCVKAGKCAPPRFHGPGMITRYCNWGRNGRDKHPVNCVDWHQAVEYCKWRGKRLPTEAEWEYAAVGKDGRVWPWGKQPTAMEFCNYAVIRDPGTGRMGCGMNGTAPVGSRPRGKSASGLYDMVGNVIEWTADCYDPSFYATCGARCANPRKQCANRKAARSYRGGSFGSFMKTSLPRRRGKLRALARAWGVGFRCAK